MQSQVVFYVDMQGKGKSPLPLHSIPKTNNNSKTKSNNKTKTKNKIKVVYTEDLTHPRPTWRPLLIFLVLCGFRHISAENFALGSLRSDDWQLGRPAAPRFCSVFSPPNANSLLSCIDPVVTGGAVKGARKGRSS